MKIFIKNLLNNALLYSFISKYITLYIKTIVNVF